MKRLGILLLISGVLGTAAVAQNVQKTYKNAESLFHRESFEEALYGFELVIQEDPKYRDAEYKRELCILLTDKRERSLSKLLYFGTKTEDPYYKYWLGRVYLERYQFDNAIEQFDLFQNEMVEISEELQQDIDDHIALAMERKAFFLGPQEFIVKHVGHNINSEASDLSPVYNSRDEEMIFTSDRNTDFEFFRIYHAHQNGDDWHEPTLLEDLGTLDPLAPNIEVVDEDGKLFLFDAAQKSPLLFSEETNGKWSTPAAFDSHLDGHEVRSHFFINEHEDRIIFGTAANDRTHGLDLFQVFLNPETGEWSKAAPFSRNINTIYDEDSPYLSPDEKTLYFSSDRPGSVGGMDIFRSTFDEETGEWSIPVSMGYPINSPDDEVNFKINPDGNHGFFSSDRLGTKGSFDIYTFEAIDNLTIKGRVIASSNGRALPGATIRLNGKEHKGNYELKTNETGNFSQKVIADDTYRIEILQNGLSLLVESMDLHKTSDERMAHVRDFVVNLPMEEKISLEPRNVVTQSKETPKVPKNGKVHDATPINTSLPNVYFDQGQSVLSTEAVNDLGRIVNLLQTKTNAILVISGYTDGTGTRKENLSLSQERAETVANWLISHGIDSDHIEIEYFGEQNPLATNDDEKEGRELNRRVSFQLRQYTSNYISKNLPNTTN